MSYSQKVFQNNTIPIQSLTFIMIALYSLMLWVTSFAVKDFKMQWNLGFRVIAGGTAIIVGTRIILSYVLLSLISAII